MKYVALLSLLILTISCWAQDTSDQSVYYEIIEEELEELDSTIYVRAINDTIYYVDGIANRKLAQEGKKLIEYRYHKNGQLKAKGEVALLIRERSEYTYNTDVLNGDPKPFVKAEIYKDAEVHFVGTVTVWDTAGNVQQQGRFNKKGLHVGPWSYFNWDSAGNNYFRWFKDGNIFRYQIVNPQGNLIKHVRWYFGKRDTTQIKHFYTAEGILKRTETYKQFLVGEGYPEVKGYENAGFGKVFLKHGVWTYFDKQGKTARYEEWIKGELPE